MKIELYEDKAGEWRWRIVSQNGRIIAVSSEGYVSRSNAKRALALVVAFFKSAIELQKNLQEAEVGRKDAGDDDNQENS